MAKKLPKGHVKCVLVADKEFADKDLVKEIIDQAEKDTKLTIGEFITGYTPALDKILLAYAREYKVNLCHVPTEWDNLDVEGAVIKERMNPWKKVMEKYNCKAAFLRNQKMIDLATLLICIDKFSNKDIRERAEKRGIIIYDYELKSMQPDDFYVKF